MMVFVKAYGGKPRLYPLIATYRVNSEAVRAKLVQPCDCLVFTSANGVRAYAEMLEDMGLSRSAQSVICVGEKTAIEVRRAGFDSVDTPAIFSADQIADLMVRRNLADTRVLMVRGNLADDALPNALRGIGCQVTDVVGYKTEPTTAAYDLIQDIASGEIAAVTFASGSAVRAFSEALGDMSQSVRDLALALPIASIGPKTSAVLVECGLFAAVTARIATGERMIQDLADYFEHVRRHRG